MIPGGSTEIIWHFAGHFQIIHDIARDRIDYDAIRVPQQAGRLRYAAARTSLHCRSRRLQQPRLVRGSAGAVRRVARRPHPPDQAAFGPGAGAGFRTAAGIAGLCRSAPAAVAAAAAVGRTGEEDIGHLRARRRADPARDQSIQPACGQRCDAAGLRRPGHRWQHSPTLGARGGSPAATWRMAPTMQFRPSGGLPQSNQGAIEFLQTSDAERDGTPAPHSVEPGYYLNGVLQVPAPDPPLPTLELYEKPDFGNGVGQWAVTGDNTSFNAALIVDLGEFEPDHDRDGRLFQHQRDLPDQLACRP